MYFLPNREYYAQLATLSQSKLRANIENVLLYAGLELLSFLVIAFVIYRRLGISPAYQLTFVLKKQWFMVQAKFVMWVLFVVQTYLYHSGASIGVAWMRLLLVVSLLARLLETDGLLWLSSRTRCHRRGPDPQAQTSASSSSG